MKKILILTLTAVLLLLGLTPSIYASLVSDSGSVGLWHVEDKAEQKDVAYIYARYNSNWSIETTGKSGGKNYEHWTFTQPSPQVTYSIEKPSAQYNQLIVETGAIDGSTMKTTNTLTTYAGKVSYTFGENSLIIKNTETDAVITSISGAQGVKVYWIKAFGGDFTTIDKLPVTTGNLERTNAGSMGSVKFSRQGLSVVSEIAYMGESYYLLHNMAPETDMDIFSSNNLSFYYTDNDGNKMILINHGNKSHFLNPNLEEFIPYTFWNLTTNEIKTVNKFDLMMYVQVEGSNNLFGYFYVDQFIIHNLLQVETTFQYYHAYDTFPWQNSNGEVQTYSSILEHDKTNTSWPTWQEKTFAATAAATAVLAWVPVVRWPALLLGGVTMWMLGSDVVEYGGIRWGNINQIEKLDYPGNKLATTLEKEYSKSVGRPVQIDPNSDKKVYKLNFGQFDKFGSSHVEIAQGTMNIISFTYETTKGIKVEYTSDDFNLRDSYSELLKPKERTGMNPALQSWIIIGLIALYVIVLITNRGFSSGKKFMTITVIYLVVILLIYGIYFLNKQGIIQLFLRVLRL